MNFKIEQVAICPNDPLAARKLLSEMGAADWAQDHVVAVGSVFDSPGEVNEADLSFNYSMLDKANELEVLHYTNGKNWMDSRAGSTPRRVSHFGMHCTEGELEKWMAFFAEREIGIAQEVWTQEHSNEVVAGKRWYHYVIFDTYDILSVDIKFIVRREKNFAGEGIVL